MATIDGINFSNIQERTALAVPGVWTNDDNINSSGKYDYDGGKSVMALDIDWNGAVLPSSNTTINTTGQLLNLINSMSSQISTLNEQVYALGAAVIAIGSKVSN